MTDRRARAQDRAARHRRVPGGGRLLATLVAGLVAALLGTAPALAEDGSITPASVGADGRLSVAVIAPITVPAGMPGLLTAAQLTRLTASDGLLTQELENSIGQPVTLAIDPRIIASIRVLGSSAPATASDWLARLAQAPNETFPLLYADADPVLTAQAGRAADLSPIGFDFALDPSHFSAPATATPSPSASATADPNAAPALPQTPAEVTGWNWTYSGIVWPAADTVVADDLPRLAAAGYTSVVLDDQNTAGPGGHVAFANAGAPSALSGLIADAALSSAASAVADSGSNGADLAESALGDETRSVAADSRGAVRVVTLQRSSGSSLRFLPAALATMEAAGATAVGLGAVIEQTASASTLVDRPEPSDRTAEVPSIMNAAAAEDAFSSVAVDPVSITAPRRLDLLALLSAGWVGDASWPAAVTSYLDASRTLLGGVSLSSSGRAVALGANPTLPVTVRNELKVPIRVYATARSLSTSLSIPAGKRRVEIVVQPDSTQTGRIPTVSVGNGRARVALSLVSASGVAVDQPTILALDVQAGWETVGTLVVLVLVLGVFGFGVTRNIRRRRAERRGGRPADDAATGDGTGSGTADARG